jgi:hypothetical protein
MNRKRIYRIVSITLVVILGFVGYELYQQKKKEMLEATLDGLKVGKKFGELVTREQCLQGLTFKYSKCNDHTCAVSAHGFIAGCMQKAKPDSYCQTVPAPSESKKLVSWAKETCKGIKLAGTKCEDYINKVSDVCSKMTSGQNRSKPEIFIDGFNRGYEKAK